MSITSAPLPTLPVEVKGHILRLCDPSTLAVTSRVSLAFLELSGPLLYRDISVRGQEQLEKLIRSKTVLESIAPYVSLMQTSTFAYTVLDNHSSKQRDISRRLSISTRVRVDTLVFDLRHASYPDLALSLDVLCDSFEPKRVHVLGQSTRRDRIGRYITFPPNVGWPNVREVTYTNAFARTFPSEAATFSCRSPPVDLVWDLTSDHPSQLAQYGVLHAVQRSLREAVDGAGLMFGRVHVWVKSKEEVALAESILVGLSCTSLDIGVKQPADA